ncbi:hypothetical protein SO802_033883 [Lithocarpus litseifolius]|uniref:Aminotransferase-like plant mobile domain-containing protein n=1 Tax=Lithocarpus litseifolius TaxID=425828 RepID=A0AAW2BG14_9ROSI
MASSSKGPSFLTLPGKKYDPTFDWHEEDGLLQDPRTHAPYCHVDTKVIFSSLAFMLGKNVVACFIESFTSLKSRGSFQMLKSAWAALPPSIKNIINEVGFGTFFKALLNHEMHEYRDLQLLLVLAERLWDTTCTFHFPCIGEVWMYVYFGVGHETWEEVAGIFPRFLYWVPQYRSSVTSRCSLEIWRLVIDNLTVDGMNLDPWAGCEGYVECERALELNGCQALFECGHGGYWYLGDQVSPQVHHVYPLTTIPVPPCPSIRLADFLTDEEIAQAYVGFVVPRTVGSYPEFIETRMQGCLAGQTPPPSEGEEEGDDEEEIPSPHPAAFKLEGIKALWNVKIKWDFLRATVKFCDPEDHVFWSNTAELCPTIEEFFAILGYDRSKKFVAVSYDPRHKESFSDALGLPTSITNSMIEGHMIWLMERLDMIAKPTNGNYGPSSFLSRAVIKTECQIENDCVKFLDRKSSTSIQWDCYWWKCPPLLLQSPGSNHIFLVGLRRATFYKGDKLLRQFKYEQGTQRGNRRKPFSPVDINPTSVKNILLGLEMAD